MNKYSLLKKISFLPCKCNVKLINSNFFIKNFTFLSEFSLNKTHIDFRMKKIATFAPKVRSMNNNYRSSFFGSIPPVVKNLIIINFLFWLASICLPHLIGFDLTDWLGLHYWQSDKFTVAQLVTYMFLHDTSSFSHLFFNMFGLWMFGKDIEQIWGTKRFLIFYFVAGIGAGITQEIMWTIDFVPVVNAFTEYANTKDISLLMPYLNVNENTVIPIGDLFRLKEMVLNQPITIGASGSIFGILLAFAMLFPNARMMLLFFPVPIRAPYFVAFYALVELFLGVNNFSGDSVAHFAHLGGMVFGLILILFWKKKGKLYN